MERTREALCYRKSFWHSVWVSMGKPYWIDVYENMKHSNIQYKYALRRLKKCNDRIQNNKFLAEILNDGRNIVDEIRKLRGKPGIVPSRIDTKVGSQDISNHFAGIYSNLYNNVENGPKLDLIGETINQNIYTDSDYHLDRINEKLICDALKKLKPNKKDSLYNTVSDCYINGPDSLKVHIKNLIRIYLVHGVVPRFLLVCTLMPLVKDNLADVTKSNNYRAIAGGCLLLKLLDLVVVILESEKLSFSELQFAYQTFSSTTAYSWAATTVIEYFNRAGRPVYGAAMDMTKAFDMVEWSRMFSLLIKRHVGFIFLRIMLFIYSNQKCQVEWSGACSNLFKVSYGVRQGAVSSAILFAIYIDELILKLKKSRLGCYIDSVFVGVFVFADDILLLSASRAGLQALVNICSDFASNQNLKF